MQGEVPEYSKVIAFVGLIIVLIMVAVGYYMDYRDRNKQK